MKIIIDIPDGCYEELNNGQFPIQDAYRLVAWIKEGTPLPKGHGALKDADAFQKTYCKENCGDRPCVDAMDRCIFIGELLLAPTIIEADREVQDDD